MSRNVVNVVVDQGPGFRRKGVKYDWRRKVGTHLPDPQSSVISSILFKPLPSGEEEEEEEEGGMEATTRRSMAWFSAAIASGVPLIFVNIQTEQIVSSCSPLRSIIIYVQERRGSPPPISRSRSRSRGKPQISNTGVQLLRGIRLWFLPGESEIPLFLSPQPGEIRFGMDIKRTEEGFICISGAAKGLAAERAGVGQMREEAAAAGQLLVISRLDGKSLIPSTVCSAGLIHCCDHSDVKATLAVSIERMDGIQLHLMRWPTQQQHQAAAPSTTTTTATTTPNHNNIQAMAIALTALRPPPSLSSSSSIESHPTCNATHSIQWSHDDSESYNDLTKNPPADPSSPFDAQDSFYHWDA
ncbi:hypothetical protein ACLOJK_025446 [Asimina triloba]